MGWLIYPRRDSNPQSPVPKTGALSIALLGLYPWWDSNPQSTVCFKIRRPSPYPLGHKGCVLMCEARFELARFATLPPKGNSLTARTLALNNFSATGIEPATNRLLFLTSTVCRSTN